MEHFIVAQFENILIRPLEIRDIELLRQWRNDEKISTYLAPIPYISVEMQKNWFDRYLLDKDNITFVIEENQLLKRVVGSISIYGFQEDQAEIGKIVIGDEEAHGKQVGYRALLLALSYGYKFLRINKFLLNVHEDNVAARTIYQKVGFKIVGQHLFMKGGYELEMELYKEWFEHINPCVVDITYCNKLEGANI